MTAFSILAGAEGTAGRGGGDGAMDAWFSPIRTTNSKGVFLFIMDLVLGSATPKGLRPRICHARLNAV